MKSYHKLLSVLAVTWLLFPALSGAQEKAQETQTASHRWKFQNETTLNATILTGNSDSITLGGSEKLKIKKNRVTNVFTSGVTYVRDDVFNDAIPATTSSRNIFVRDKVIWDFGKKTYTYVGGGWLTNQTSGINHQFDGFTGLGYKLLETPKHSLSVEAGYQFERQTGVVPFRNEGVTHNASFGFAYLLNITDKTSVENETSAVMEARNANNFRVSSTTQLKVEIIKHLALTLGFKLQFDNSPVPSFRKLDTVSTTGLTFTFE